MAGETIGTVATIDSGPAKAGAEVFNSALSSMRDGVVKTSQAIDSMTGATALLRTGFGLLVGAFAVKEIISAADEYTRLKVRLESLTGSAQAGAEVLHSIKDAARDARVPAADLADAYGKIVGQLKDHNMSSQQAVDSLGLMSKAVQLGGGDAAAAARANEIYANSFVHGRVEMRQFFTLMQDAPILMQKLQEQTGLSAEQLRKMGQYGKITADTLRSVLVNSADEINAKYTAMPRTIGGAFTQLANALTSSIGKAFSDSGTATSEFVKGVDAARDALKSDAFVSGVKKAADVLGVLMQALVSGAKALRDYSKVYDQVSAEKANETWADYFSKLGANIKYFFDVVDMGYVKWQQFKAAALNIDSLSTSLDKLAQAEARAKIGAWQTTVAPTKTASSGSVQFGESDIEKQAKIAMEIERQQGELARARALDDKDAVAAVQVELDVRQKVTKELRESDKALAAAYESQIRVTDAAKRQAEILAENKALAQSFGQTISDDLINGIKAGNSFSDVMKKMAVDMIELIAKVLILGPLLKSLGVSGGSALSGVGFNPEKLFGGLFPGFASGGSFNVGGTGGTDSQLVAFKASPDERVTISTPGQQSAGGGGQQIVFHFAPTVTGDATDATLARMEAMARRVLFEQTPQLMRTAKSAVADAHRRDRNYLVR